MFLILLAALSNVDKSQTEAAAIDGAGYWRTFRKIVLPAIWPVMAIAILIRGLDLFRIFDIIWALTQGGPGTMTETISIYTYVAGLQAVRDQLHGGDRLPCHRPPDRGRDLGDQADGAGEMSSTAVSPPQGCPPRLALSRGVPAGRHLRLPGLLAVHHLVQDAGRDLRLPAGLVSREHPVRQLLRAVQGRRRRDRVEQPGPGRRQHVHRHVPRHHCAYSLVRFKTGGENLAVWIISQRMMPPVAIVFPIFLLYVCLRLGRHLSSA